MASAPLVAAVVLVTNVGLPSLVNVAVQEVSEVLVIQVDWVL